MVEREKKSLKPIIWIYFFKSIPNGNDVGVHCLKIALGTINEEINTQSSLPIYLSIYWLVKSLRF